MLRFAPAAAIAALVLPVLFGLLATIVPAFGYFPALGGVSLSLEPFRQLLALPGIGRSVTLSFTAGLVSALVSVLAVAAFMAGWSHTRAFQIVQHFLSPILAVPHAAAAFGLAFLFSPSGWLMRLVSPELTGFDRPPDWLIINDPHGLAMMAGLAAKEMPFLFLMALTALPQADAPRSLAMASSLGYGRMAGFIHGVWPRLYPQVRLPVFAVIAYSVSVVDVAIILGPTNPPVLGVRLVNAMNDPDLAMRFMASAGGVLQLLIAIAAILAWIVLERIGGALLRSLAQGGRRMTHETIARQGAALLVLILAVPVFLGLMVLALWSVADAWRFPDALPSSITLATWQNHLPGLAHPLLVTLVTGAAATLIALTLVIASLERETRLGRNVATRGIWLVYLPLIVPQLSFVFGLQLFILAAGLGPSFVALVLVHLVFVLPYVFLSLSGPWRSFDPRLAQAALSLGATPSRVFWQVRLPFLLKPVLAAGAVGFAVSVSLYLPTLLIGAGRLPTLATEAVALSAGGDRRVTGVYAFVQLLLPGLVFMIAALIPAMVFSNRRGMQGNA